MSNIPTTDNPAPVFAPAGEQNASYPCDPADPTYDASLCAILTGQAQGGSAGYAAGYGDPGIGGSSGGYPTPTPGPGNPSGGPGPFPAPGSSTNPATTGIPGGAPSWVQQIVAGADQVYQAFATLAWKFFVNQAAVLILLLGIWLLIGREGRETVIATARKGAEVAAA